MRYEWNTGRHYTTHGQRIIAQTMADHIAFVDRDRGIYGTISLPKYRQINNARDMQEYVMGEYDYNRYESGREAHEFAILLWQEEQNKTA